MSDLPSSESSEPSSPPPVLPKPIATPAASNLISLSAKPPGPSLAAKPLAARPTLKLSRPSGAPPPNALNPSPLKTPEPKFQSPMPDAEDESSVPVWQPILAGLSAAASLTVAVLLFIKR